MQDEFDDKNTPKLDDDHHVIDLSDARDKKKKDSKQKQAYIPKSWNISYKNDNWQSGDRRQKVGAKGMGNSGYKGTQEPLFNFSKIPAFTRFVVVALIVVHVILAFVIPREDFVSIMQIFAFIPAIFMGMVDDISFLKFLSPISYMFLHADWVHLLFNVMMMVAFGTMVERQFGLKFTAFFFFMGGLLGASVFCVLHTGQVYQLIGASAGISALFGVAIHVTSAQIRMMNPGVRTMPFYGFVLLWCAILIVTGVLGQGVAWPSHLAGFLGGVALFELYKRRYSEFLDT